MASGSRPAGFHHPRVRSARLLHQKKHRQTQRCFLVEGATLVAEALDAGAELRCAYSPATLNPGIDALLGRLEAAGVATYRVDDRALTSLARTRTPQGIVAVAAFVDRQPSALADILPPGLRGFILVLDHISDPGNAGTLVRSAHAFGAAAVCFGRHSVDPYNAKTVRATMGALFRIPIIAYDDWALIRRELYAADVSIIAAQAGAVDVREITLDGRLALLIGHERQGHAGLPTSNIAAFVGIPQAKHAESLNAGIAGSIILYEVARRTQTRNSDARR